jgi:hypothetical protein
VRGVLVVADADERLVEELHHGGQHLLLRQPPAVQVLVELRPQVGQPVAEVGEPLVLLASRTSRQRAW